MKKLAIAIALTTLTTALFAQTPQSAADAQKEKAAVAKEAKTSKAEGKKVKSEKSAAPKAVVTPSGK